jgi:hypothetical protein
MQKDKQEIGPICPSDFKLLEVFFTLNNIDFEVEVDDVLKAEADHNMDLYGNGEFDHITRRVRNRFDYSKAKFLYVYLSSENALKSKSYLRELCIDLNRENVGVSKETVDELFASEDYMCIECDYHSLKPGICPEHAQNLLPYYEWVKAKNEKDNETLSSKLAFYLNKYILYIFALGFVCFLIYKK